MMKLSIKPHVRFWCALVLLASSVSHAHGVPSAQFPSLLRPYSTAEAVISSLELPPDASGVRLAGRPNIQISSLDTSLLRSRPAGLSLSLPAIQGSLQVSHQPNIQVNADVDFDQADVSTSSGSVDQQRFPTVWVGKVAGLRPGYSAVVLTHDEAKNVVRGSVRFWDRKAKTFRIFRIEPVAKQGDTTAAAASGSAAAAGQAAGTDLNDAAYMTYEIEEPQVVDSDPIHPTAFEDAVPADTAADLNAATAALAPTADPLDAGSVTTAASNGDPSNIPILKLVRGESSASDKPTDSNAATAAAEAAGSGSRRLQQSAPLAIQDVLVVYTSKAAAAVGGEDQLLARAQQNIVRANLAYNASNVQIQLTLLAFKPWSYDETGKTYSTILNDLMQDTAMATLRDTVGADLVVGLNGGVFPIGSGFYCGLGALGGGAPVAYSIVHGGLCTEGYTMAHEVGHNQGCMHAKEQGGLDQPGAAGPYARGWRRCDWPATQQKSFNTIMAYQCSNVSANTAIGLYSSPDLKTATGVTAGNATDGDCARGLRETAKAVAGYRVRNQNPLPSPSPGPSSSPRPSPSPAPVVTPKTTWFTKTGCNGVSAVLNCPVGTTVGLVSIRLGRWSMTADVCPGPPGSTSPIGITPRNKVYNTDASSQAKNIFTMPADLVKVVKEDLYLARLTFARQYEIVYGCDIRPGAVIYQQKFFCPGERYVVSCPAGYRLHASSLLVVGRWNNTACTAVAKATWPRAKVYPLTIPAASVAKNSATSPADIVTFVKEDIYPGVDKQFGWVYGCWKP